MSRHPELRRPDGARFQFHGFVGERLRAAVQGWLLPAPRANPSMLRMFLDRDRLPRRDLVPWAGEFVGKHLTASALVHEVTADARLAGDATRLVRELAAAQDMDGYLGPHPRAERLTGKSLSGHALWDVWGHYHCIVGLLLWSRIAGTPGAQEVARRAGEAICRTFLDGDVPLAAAGAEEMNMAIGHGMSLLYRETNEPRFLRMAKRVLRDWETPPAGDYLRLGLAGKEFWETPKPRWESLHDLMALPELYWITGDEGARRAFEHFWWSILKGDRHNTGGFTSGEQAVGNPYATGAIETCCTVAWIALSIEMLRLTGDPRVADEIELATFNGGLGGQHPSGRWWTYNTPMDGVRLASAHEIVFQSHPGGPELNCCSVNGPRVLGMLAEWSLLQSPGGVSLHYYGPAILGCALPSGNRLTLAQETDYPRSGDIGLSLALDRPERFTLRLRIPQWSAHTSVRVNGEPGLRAEPGAYAALEREWRTGDRVDLALDMSPHFWAGEREQAGKCSVYRGPILLAYEQRFNPFDPDDVPELDARALTLHPEPPAGEPEPWVLLRARSGGEQAVVLCDFASAGAAGTHYRSWLPVSGVAPAPFSRERAVWARRLAD